MSEQNGASRFPPRAVARRVGEFAHDVVTLAELQAELLKADARDELKRLVLPVALLVAAAAILLGTVPVALMALAWGLADSGLATWAAFLIAAVVGLALAAAAATVAWVKLRNAPDVFGRSKEEFRNNVAWLKHVLKNRNHLEKTGTTSPAEQQPSP